MARSTTGNLDATVIARVLIALIDGGGSIKLVERTPNISVPAPPAAVRALSRVLNSLACDSEDATAFVLRQLVNTSEAARLSKYPEADILARIERGELGGLRADRTWFILQDRVRSLEALAAADKFFAGLGYRRGDTR